MYHANKDRKVLCTIDFILIHRLLLKIYLNERPFEPRERDYALVVLMSLPYGSVLEYMRYMHKKFSTK
jgi:hypothetical protein